MLMRRARFRPDHPAPGIRRHGLGWQASVTERGERAYQAFPLDTPVAEMVNWQKDERAGLRLMTSGRPAAGTFAHDARRYLALEAVKAMPTYAERRQHMLEWVAVFGTKRRRKITALEIEDVRARLLARGRMGTEGDPRTPYGASSVNKRLRALSNLWTKLDGRRAPNPVAEVAECAEPDPQARGLSYDVIDAILNEMPEHAVGVKKDGTRTAGKPRPNLAKVICTIYGYAGLSPEQLKAVDRADVDFQAGTLRQTARRKGRKLHRAHDRALPVLVPLQPRALEAFRQFDALKLWRRLFSNSTVSRGFHKACARLGLTGLRVYDLRHSFLSLVYAETRDLRVTGTFGGHRSERTTKRYTIAAVAPHVAAAAERVRAKLASGVASDAENSSDSKGIVVDARADATTPNAVSDQP